MAFNNEEQNTKNMIIAILAFIVVMFLYNFFSGNSNNVTTSEQIEAENNSDNIEKDLPAKSAQPLAKEASRIFIENSNFIVAINLNGGILDEITLKKYKQSTQENSAEVMLLTHKGTDSEYYYAINYKDKTNDDNISDDTVWSIIENNANKAVIQTKTQNGLIVERSITLDDGYVVTIKDRIINGSNKDISISKIVNLVRTKPIRNNYAVVHEGLIYNYKKDNAERKHTNVCAVKYSKIENKEVIRNCNWIGYTDIYWLCSILNYDDASAVSYSKIGDDSYKISLYTKSYITIPENKAIELKHALYAGPKDINVLKNYADNLGIDKFEMTIDFGWFFMITKPLVYLMDFLASLFSNMGLVILLLTLLFKIITYPLIKKSFESAGRMREIQPKIVALQKMYGSDKMRMNQEIMSLYKREKVSPMSGCLPMILQAPIFFCLYKVFFISIEMRHAPLFGWIHDLSAPDSLYIFNLFGLIDWDLPGFLKIGVWPLIMGITMLIQQKLSSASGGKKNIEKTQEMKIQENMMLIMPILFTYICASFPVSIVIYWTISNIFSMVQQYYVNSNIKKANKKDVI
ncbi:MAG: membrane protein insertase YidC [Holosporales bacterium]|jgi:YidC/Oxa1 family membrane protein insertase|nr:membrane protein insertase YidC [Holosporales bacterium]